MTAVAIWFDVALATVLVWLCWAMLTSPGRFRAVVVFITFSIVMSICWVRLRAPDLALVEAAIGAGLTGLLFLDALGRLEADEAQQ
ncbi:MAG: Na(+)/H(+) antiporter subunit B [Persicimonas sp.]